MNSAKVLLGILAGASAGALLGILLAPQKGQDTRRKIEKTSKKYAKDFKHKFEQTLNGVTDKFNEVKEEVSEFAHQTKVKAEKLKKENGLGNS